jgi:two-component system osmolarity sensor histidine kinase EnvZ
MDRLLNRVIIEMQLENGVYTVSAPESRLFSSSGYVFILMLVGSSFALMMISIIFLRNQIRPIHKLAAAAALMGKGRFVSLGRLGGAKEVRQAAEAFETMQRRIRRQMEQRTALLAGVSHDLRTPLTRVKLGLSMLDDQKEAQEMIKDLDEMEKMISAYLEFARGEKFEDAENIILNDFLVDITELYNKEDFKIIIDDRCPVGFQMLLQRVNFRRAIENILSNASRYATRVFISLILQEERLQIIIEDNGCGIPESQYEEAMKPFVRLDPSRSKETGGAGLGLSVTADIITSHGGKINLGRSENHGGLLISIRLPI